MTRRLPFDFMARDGVPLDLEDVIFQSLGAASTCWSSVEEAGVFDSVRAKDVGDKLIRWIKENKENKDPLLGLATTRHLLEELCARMTIGATTHPEQDLGLLCEVSLNTLPDEVLEYRTVDYHSKRMKNKAYNEGEVPAE